MIPLRQRVLSGDFMAGMWCSLSSSTVTEAVGLCGYDWALLDGEHSPSSTHGFMQQMQSLSRFSTAPIVRIPWLDRVHIKWVLDIGAAGIMIPYVETAEQAREALSYMQYPPHGVRGVGGAVRACDYGLNFANYFAQANDSLLTIVQLETQLSLDNAAAIAATDGVDVLFVGPMDLSASIGMPKRFDDPHFMKILQYVADCARAENKACGILLPRLDLVPTLKAMGYTFVAVSSDISLLVQSFKQLKEGLCRLNSEDLF